MMNRCIARLWTPMISWVLRTPFDPPIAPIFQTGVTHWTLQCFNQTIFPAWPCCLQSLESDNWSNYQIFKNSDCFPCKKVVQQWESIVSMAWHTLESRSMSPGRGWQVQNTDDSSVSLENFHMVQAERQAESASGWSINIKKHCFCTPL